MNAPPATPAVLVAYPVNRYHPGIQLSMGEARETELIERLRKRDIEVAILRLSLIEPPDDMDVIQLFDERLCVIAAADHPLARHRHLKWADLLAQRWVLSPADCAFYLHVQRTLEQVGLSMPTQVVEALSIQLQFNLVVHAGMLGFGMRSQIDFAPGKGHVVRLPVVGTDVSAVMLASHEPSPLARQLLGHIRDLVAEAVPTPAMAAALAAGG